MNAGDHYPVMVYRLRADTLAIHLEGPGPAGGPPATLDFRLARVRAVEHPAKPEHPE